MTGRMSLSSSLPRPEARHQLRSTTQPPENFSRLFSKLQHELASGHSPHCCQPTFIADVSSAQVVTSPQVTNPEVVISPEMFDKKKKRSSSLVRDEIRDRGDYFSIDSKEKYALRAAHF